MDDWVLDSLVGFLQSPTWSNPISSFTDQNCVVFDPGEENKFSYTDIHKEYQKLVEDMLESFTSDLGISGDQFTQACSQLQASKAGQDNEELFDQVLAADDFLAFKDAMVRRNIDLELQALTLLKKQMGHSPLAYDRERTGDYPTIKTSSLEDEEKVLEKAMKMSEAQYNLEHSMDDEELQRLIEQAKKESLHLYQQQMEQREEEEGGQGEEGGQRETAVNVGLENTASRDGAANKEEVVWTSSVQGGCAPQPKGTEEKPKHESDTQQGHTVTETAKGMRSTTAVLPPLAGHTQSLPTALETTRERKLSDDTSGVGSGHDAMTKWLEGAQSDLHSDSTKAANRASNTPHTQLSSGPTHEQLKAREMYLKQQRDHLLEMKKQQRAQVFQSHTASTDGSKRPKSAQVAQAATEGSERAGSGARERVARHARNTGVLSSVIAGSLKKT